MENIWNVALAGVPFGLGVASINIGKHIDKLDDDKKKGVGPSRCASARRLPASWTRSWLVLMYPVIVYLVFVPRYFTPVMLIVFLAFKHALNAIKMLNSPRRLRRRPITRSGRPGSPPGPSSTTGSTAGG